MRVVIHADASPAMGTGHLIRSLALGAALRAAGAEVTLASDELLDALRERAASAGIAVVTRGAAPRDPDWLVVDGYHLDAASRAALAEPSVPRLVVDDLGADLDGATLVVNQNLYARPGHPPSPPGTEILAGPAYALLRPEFAHAGPERPQPAIADRVLVTMGGADPNDATSVAVTALATLGAHRRVVVGAAHPARDQVERSAADAGFEVVRDATTLADHLAWCDVVVSACGTSILEAARVGRPIVGVVLADNQRAVADAVEREGLGVIAGEHPTLDADALRTTVDGLMTDRSRREAMTAVGPALVDGKGARRVVRAMTTGPLHVRDATMEDADRLLAWRNDPAAREASFDTTVVPRATHVAWLEERLASSEHRILIGELGGTPIGVVRFAIEDERAAISVTLDPEHRAGGLGARLIAAGSARMASATRVRAIDAWIRRENAASIVAFRTAGYRQAASASDRLRFELPMG